MCLYCYLLWQPTVITIFLQNVYLLLHFMQLTYAFHTFSLGVRIHGQRIFVLYVENEVTTTATREASS